MKKFITKHKKILILISIIIAVVLLLTTTAVTGFKIMPFLNPTADNIKTCSIPTGEVVSKGIDVSRYQGEIDFNQVKSEGYDFVIIRVGTSQGGKDANFDTYYQNAVNAGLDVGCYYYTYATTKKETRQEAKEVLTYIKGKTFTYPVFYDFEYPELLSTYRASKNTEMINTFCTVIKRGGYYPGVYLSNSAYENHVNYEEIGKTWDVWVAHYIDNTPNSTAYSKNFSMWQYSCEGSVSGISTAVDLNVCYVDYPSIIDEFNKSYLELAN